MPSSGTKPGLERSSAAAVAGTATTPPTLPSWLTSPGDGGLSSEQVRRSLEEDGFNELPSRQRRGPLRILREVLTEPMFALLLAAGGIYLILGDLGEAILLLLFANFSLGIAVVQEMRSERVLEALRELTSPRALVIRDGEQQRIAGREVVRGDLLLIGEGDRVPADAILIEGSGVEVDESLLTGESVSVRKRVVRANDEADAVPGGDDLPFLYSGTLVVRGGGRAITSATGSRTRIGQIGNSLASIVVEPPRLQAQTRRLVRIFGGAGITLSLGVIVLYATLRDSLTDALLAGIAVGMSLLPEEFPLILTVFMVMGAWRISAARVLTRRASAIESLGAATVLCTDKTGTLTHNRMAVVRIVPWNPNDSTVDDKPTLEVWSDTAGSDSSPTTPMSKPAAAALEAAVLASSPDAIDSMDRAIHDLAGVEHGDLPALLAGFQAVREFGLTPELLAVTRVFADHDTGALRVASKGAPEAIASLCGFSDEQGRQLAQQIEEMALQGMRVLAVAEARIAHRATPERPQDVPLEMRGLIGFADPLRDGVADAIREAGTAGVRVVMITGDYPTTASVIAREAGIRTDSVLTGSELAALDDDTLGQRLRDCSVFARIQPDQKLRIVQALQAQGEVVAMTGDGVNDAPSLQAAHIGIAMGGRGTDVAREASSIVLLDDDFRAIVQTVRLGRRIYDNLRKAMGYVVALHIPIAGLAVLPLLLGMPLILTPTIIAFLEMVIDPVCSVVFEAETEEADIMKRPPRDPAGSLLPVSLLVWHGLQGTLALLLVVTIFARSVYVGHSEEETRAAVFAGLVFTNLAMIFANRSFAASWRLAMVRPNPLLWWAVAASLTMLTVVLTWPPARELFRLGSLQTTDLGICALAAALLFASIELIKGAWKTELAQ